MRRMSVSFSHCYLVESMCSQEALCIESRNGWSFIILLTEKKKITVSHQELEAPDLIINKGWRIWKQKKTIQKSMSKGCLLRVFCSNRALYFAETQWQTGAWGTKRGFGCALSGGCWHGGSEVRLSRRRHLLCLV